eukprot:CAMPEP_0178384300 /NCGR_PEP_ID=MMETSP0689_2-20121128/7445_1 /TAXON_ID=160604 /ORGANISM="Amphidinium massartii, Strain CS-259" /LENGTH=101 /DNA_ID=CAMNT_0020004545 /DNA_START=1326 /DNA_END=1629 /DNA_ORIENTATION=+
MSMSAAASKGRLATRLESSPRSGCATHSAHYRCFHLSAEHVSRVAVLWNQRISARALRSGVRSSASTVGAPARKLAMMRRAATGSTLLLAATMEWVSSRPG